MRNDTTTKLGLAVLFCGLTGLAACTHRTNSQEATPANSGIGSTITNATPTPVPSATPAASASPSPTATP